MPGQAFEHPCHRFHQLAQVGPFRRQAEATGLDAGDVENIADQLQQALRRGIGDLDAGAVHPTGLGTLERQFEDADHRIHRRAYLVAHGRQEGGLGPARFVGQVLRFFQFVDQLAVLGDVQPATDDTADGPAGIAERLDPVVDPALPAAQRHRVDRLDGPASRMAIR